MSSELTPEEFPQQSTKKAPARGTQSAVKASELATARSAHWHQAGDALLSMEALRPWLNRSGLVLYAPKPQGLGAPAPTLVEAVLGKAAEGTGLAEQETAKSLLTRLVAEGGAVPLNLMGVAGGVGTDAPDFVVSAGVFSYVFTLRGNKAWKQAPATSGALKVSPLAAAAYAVLAEKGMMSAAALAAELGKEVTETGVLRALTELWGQLRVIPVAGAEGGATGWELTQTRFTKQMKAGANAGQPSALSALISLYLGQALMATEEEIGAFLSPLAARSRVREVVHALTTARQLEAVVIDGRTLLHVAGETPVAAAETTQVSEPEAENAGEGSRIKKFAAKPGSKLQTGLRARPAFGKKPAFGERKSFGERKPFGERKTFGEKREFGARREEGERRPFRRDDGDKPRFEKPRFDKPRFDKPWEERKPRVAREDGDARPPQREFKPRREGGSARPPQREFGGRPSGGFQAKRPGGFGSRPAFGDRPKFGDRTKFGGKPAFGDKPKFGGKPAFGKKPWAGKREEGAEGGGEQGAERKTFRRFDAPRGPRLFGAKPGGDRGGFAGKKPFGAKPAGGFVGKKPFGRAGGAGPKTFGAGKPRAPRPEGGRDGGFRPVKRKRPEEDAE